MIVTLNELLNTLNDIIGENTSDEALSMIENLTDTFNDLSTKATNNDAEQWKSKFEENDKAWREKYKARFMSGGSEPPDPPEPPEPPEKKTFESLFKEEE